MSLTSHIAENRHAPSERLDLENDQRGILSAANLYEELERKAPAPAPREAAHRAPRRQR